MSKDGTHGSWKKVGRGAFNRLFRRLVDTKFRHWSAGKGFYRAAFWWEQFKELPEPLVRAKIHEAIAQPYEVCVWHIITACREKMFDDKKVATFEEPKTKKERVCSMKVVDNRATAKPQALEMISPGEFAMMTSGAFGGTLVLVLSLANSPLGVQERLDGARGIPVTGLGIGAGIYFLDENDQCVPLCSELRITDMGDGNA